MMYVVLDVEFPGCGTLDELKTKLKAAEAAKEGPAMSKLELSILAGPESKGFLASFSTEIDRLEKLASRFEMLALDKAPSSPLDIEPQGEIEADEEVLEAAPAKKKRGPKPKAPVAASFDEDIDEEEPAAALEAEADEEVLEAAPEEDDEDENFGVPVKKAAAKAKPKKITIDDCLDAAKARSRAGGTNGRAEVLALMQKHFKVKNVSLIKADQETYAKFLKVMEVTAEDED